MLLTRKEAIMVSFRISGENMNDFTILHLSDLHFNKKGKQLPDLMVNLLSDIKEQLKYINNLIIVVTGDLVHRGNYEYKNSVLTFFEKLSDIVGSKAKDIYIIPGNHDKVRNCVDSKMLEDYDKKEAQEFYQDYWKYVKFGFSQYQELVKEIYAKFNCVEDVERKIKTDLYGVSVTELSSINKKIAFLQFNTAWACTGDADERKLKIGAFQLESIVGEYEDLKGEKKYDLTIALAHHPLDWLTGEEENLLRTKILSNYSLDCDVYISGHIHNRDVTNLLSPRHSLTTLVSGIGWPDDERPTSFPHKHTYSWYQFNLDLNSIDVYVRSSNDINKFQPDLQFYTTQQNRVDEKIVMPIDQYKTQPYFYLSTVEGRTSKVCYFTGDTVKWLQTYMTIIGKCRIKVYKELEKIKYDTYDIMKYLLLSDKRLAKKIDVERLVHELYDIFYLGIDHKNIVKFIYKTRKGKRLKNFWYDEYSGYLQAICSSLANAISCTLKENKVEEDKEGETEGEEEEKIKECDVRVHFRCLDLESDNYYHLCTSILGEENYMQSLKWGQLLQSSYETKKPLVASINREYCAESYLKNETKEKDQKKWIDFLTAVPNAYRNAYLELDRETEQVIKRRPWVTFGITIYKEEYTYLLYLMDFFRIDDVISDFFHQFEFYIPIDYEDFANYIIKGKEGVKNKNETGK